MENILPTRGQLERQLSQTLQSIYREQFGHSTSKITCHLFKNKVAIVAEDTVTKIEKILLDNSQLDLAHSLRSIISKTFATQIKQAIGHILQVEVIDLVSDSSLDSGYLGILVFLNNAPEIRLTKVRAYKNQNSSGES